MLHYDIMHYQYYLDALFIYGDKKDLIFRHYLGVDTYPLPGL